jgi:hypothetical protein
MPKRGFFNCTTLTNNRPCNNNLFAMVAEINDLPPSVVMAFGLALRNNLGEQKALWEKVDGEAKPKQKQLIRDAIINGIPEPHNGFNVLEKCFQKYQALPNDEDKASYKQSEELQSAVLSFTTLKIIKFCTAEDDGLHEPDYPFFNFVLDQCKTVYTIDFTIEDAQEPATAPFICHCLNKLASQIFCIKLEMLRNAEVRILAQQPIPNLRILEIDGNGPQFDILPEEEFRRFFENTLQRLIIFSYLYHLPNPRVVASLPRMESLESLKLRFSDMVGNRPEEEDTYPLVIESLRGLLNLRYLSLQFLGYHNSLDTKRKLTKLLNSIYELFKHGQLNELDCFDGFDFGITLAEKLLKNTKLRKLALSVEHQDLSRVIAILKQTNTLQECTLSLFPIPITAHIEKTFFAQVAGALRQNKTLHVLDIDGTCYPPEKARDELTSLMTVNRTLTSLHLPDEFLPKEVELALARNRALAKRGGDGYVVVKTITTDGDMRYDVVAIEELLRKNAALPELEIFYINEATIFRLASALRENTTLKTLRIYMEFVDVAQLDISKLAETLQPNTGLTVIEFHDFRNHQTIYQCPEIESILARNRASAGADADAPDRPTPML